MGNKGNEEKTGPPVSHEPSWDRLGLYLRDRGEDNYKKHADVAREAGVSVKWLEDRLREESVQGFELADASWVTTLRSVWMYLEREAPETPRKLIGTWSDVQRLAPKPFMIRPRVSRAGDCVFMYFAQDEAWADRVDDFLTIYHALGDRRIVGFKLKNLKLLTARLGDIWVEFQTAEFRVYMLIQRVLEASLRSPTFDHETLPKYRDIMETAQAQAMTASPIPALV